jgi:O-antigen/teichoic acid export membrane protein
LANVTLKGQAHLSAYRVILRATAIVGGASAMNILIGLARNKVAAILLGPAGIGTIGLLLNLVTTVASLAGLGIAMSGVRALASAADDDARSHIRQVVGTLTLLLAAVGGIGIWLLRKALAQYVLGNVALAGQVGLLAPAVAFTIWSAMQISLLNGLRRLSDLAQAQVGGALLGTFLGILALLLWGQRGITAYVIAAPLGMVIIGFIYTARAPRRVKTMLTTSQTRREMRALIQLGLPLMLGGLAMPLGLLIIRSILGDRLGPAALGQFTAAWTLSATYIGFVLAAMGTDYFPRLSAAIHDHAVARQLVNDQTEVALLLALPVMLGMQTTAPWLIRMLYSDAFTPAVTILHWQIAGDVLKITSWPLAFVVLAQGRGKLFWGIEALFMSTMAGAVWLLVDWIGLVSAGVAYFVAYALYWPTMLFATKRMIGLYINLRAIVPTLLGLFALILISIMHNLNSIAALVIGLSLTLTSAIYCFFTLREKLKDT